MWPKDSIKRKYIVSLFLEEEMICKPALQFQEQVQYRDWCVVSVLLPHITYVIPQKGNSAAQHHFIYFIIYG